MDTWTIEPEISDLFFNHSHKNYDALFNDSNSQGATMEDIREAIEIDARMFASDYPTIVAVLGVTAEQLASDFMRRL